MKIDLQIRRLIMEGLPISTGDGPALCAAIERELSRLLARHGLSPDLMQTDLALNLTRTELSIDSLPPGPAMGKRIAQALFERLAEGWPSAAAPLKSSGRRLPVGLRREMQARLGAAEAEGPLGRLRPATPSTLHARGDTYEGAARRFAESLGTADGRADSAAHVDLSGVRVHTDQGASRAVRAVRARAFTVGRHIFFNEGAYDPDSATGKRLIAHELAHVIQQSGTRPHITDDSAAFHIQRDDYSPSERLELWRTARTARLRCRPAELQDLILEDWLMPYFRGEVGEGPGLMPPYIWRPGDLAQQEIELPEFRRYRVKWNLRVHGVLEAHLFYRYRGEREHHLVIVRVIIEERQDGDYVVARWIRAEEGLEIEIYRQQARIVNEPAGCRLEEVPMPRGPDWPFGDVPTPREERLRRSLQRPRRG